VLPDSAYFRRQADICAGLALACQDDKSALRLIAMAQQFLMRAAETTSTESDGPVLSDNHSLQTAAAGDSDSGS
jgi:hypothetical protein